MTSTTRCSPLWLLLFAVAMAHLEATVVVYLRELFYPDGFDFPLVIIEGRIAWFEIGREVSTIVMLVAVGKLAAPRDPWRQFAGFLIAFGVWDEADCLVVTDPTSGRSRRVSWESGQTELVVDLGASLRRTGTRR